MQSDNAKKDPPDYREKRRRDKDPFLGNEPGAKIVERYSHQRLG
jgi:hypothetical protein